MAGAEPRAGSVAAESLAENIELAEKSDDLMMIDPTGTEHRLIPELSRTTPEERVLVVDFGAQYSQLIARRVREAKVYSEIVPSTLTAAEFAARRPSAIILSGGPKSVHVEGAPVIDPAVYELGIPILGICYGAQLIAQQLGGTVGRGGSGEYGRTTMTRSADAESVLLTEDIPQTQDVWMSHFDAVVEVPEGFRAIASTPGAQVAVLENPERKIFGVQYHPEVVHSPFGQQLIEEFLHQIVGLSSEWTMENFVETSVAAIRAQVGTGRAICGLSGGVDSAVAAALVHKAIGSQLTCVFVDTGLMRKNEGEQVVETFHRHQGLELIHVQSADRFFEKLAGLTDPEEKRKAIGELFIRVFEDARGGITDAQFLVQGTLYPDVIESGTAHAATIKSHHNVGGLPDDLDFDLVEPLRSLFKDEVRAVGSELGLPDEIVWRQPFPGPGLGVRIIGEVTPDKVAVLQEADAIVREELRLAGLEREIWQSFAVLPDIRTVGVMGDERTYGYPVIIRAVTSEDAMTADWARIPYDVLEKMASRIINEVPGVNRVAYDITSKPPGTIEWE
ncbi:GMP synthase (glutamine-hydrolyzing) [Actinobacteria bacterium IMCC26207]|nr:GMP synthase (glutamine-hydrolyzing) [Actinobacteria bacterium IMCC26207]